MTEKVILTKRQAKFIEDHRKAKHEDSEIAYKIARVGWGFGPMLADETEEEYNSKEGWSFENNEKMKMLTALINGYEIKKEEKWALAMQALVKNERVTVFYRGDFWLPSDRLESAMEFESEEKAKEFKEENGISGDYCAFKIK